MAAGKRKASPNTKASKKSKSQGTVAVGLVDSVATQKLQARRVIHHALVTTATLVDVNLDENQDSFCILQIIKKGNTTDHFFFSRSGSTGTEGEASLDGPLTYEAAFEAFKNVFLEKTGVNYDPQTPFERQDGKFDLLKPASFSAPGTWEYFIDDGVDGKATGWHPYTDDGSERTEFLWQTLQSNQGYTKRIVQSGHFSYVIDLIHMTQTNIQTNKQRSIRRIGPEATVAATEEANEATVEAVATAAPTMKPKNKQLREFTVATVDDKDLEVNLALIDAANNIDKFIDLSLVMAGQDAFVWTIQGCNNEREKEVFDGPLTRDAGIAKFKEAFKNYTDNEWDQPFEKKDGWHDILTVPTTLEVMEETSKGQKVIATLMLPKGSTQEKELVEDVWRWFKCNRNYPQRLVKLYDVLYRVDFEKMTLTDCATQQVEEIKVNHAMQ
ncbi:hypothetical protein THRCLA_11453 [Thraustotheca clavata]|uniref:NAD(+) ADP-ribosyltransferase n=1 Tax=Thraustotheca clavata TaxID=74557 RepID=A0A1V9Y7N4_9STRA|nr:hypothetical protein THRCLA_11453 [Thraustotheca clavata]